MKNILAKLGSNKELAIVVLVLFILAMMVIPLPHSLMDFIIAFNIGITIIVLMVVVYIDSPLQLTSFPSILLILATLRIGITISTSRLILLDANAGKIVETFGEFVVGGNLIVGIIIFVIITIVNFIVITKGSERVAEVAARFSLDAMPGKQMSIDSDLRAGTIDMHEATRRRKALGLESKLYGAMDGAMKFVKGDAIASIIDILINLIGGLVVGMAINAFSFSQALETYSILTIGDGLVQQIPALIISLTAGMMITRVNDEGDKQNLGESILNQMFVNPKALVAASFLLIILALVPGMPSWVFITLFTLLTTIAWFMYKKFYKSGQTATATSKSLIEETQTKEQPMENFQSWKLAPLLVYAADNLKNASYINTIKTALVNVQKEILFDIGVEIPQIILKYNQNLEENNYQILVFEIPVATAKIYPEHILLLEQNESLFEALEVSKPIPNELEFGGYHNGTWINRKCQTKCDEYSLNYLTIEQFLTLHIGYVIKQNVAEFLGIQEVKNLLDKMEEYQDLIRELLRIIPLNKITEILQRLVAENISIRNFKVILDAMLEWSQREKEIIVITEQVRKALGRYIAHKFSQGTYLIPCFLLDSNLEDMIRDAIRFTNNGSYLALDPQTTRAIIAQVQEIYGQYNPAELKVPPVIVTQLDIRRYVRSILEKKLGFMHVLSFQELEGYVEFNGLGVIQVE